MQLLLIILQRTEEESDLVVTFVLIVVLLIVWLVLRRVGKRGKRTFRSTSLRNLRRRYLHGEISDEEYDRQKRDLTDSQE